MHYCLWKSEGLVRLSHFGNTPVTITCIAARSSYENSFSITVYLVHSFDIAQPGVVTVS